MSSPVFLRNGQTATVTGRCDVAGYALQGYRHSPAGDVLELWTEQGRWANDQEQHPYDIVKRVKLSGEQIAEKESTQ